jgi:uncharacterized repeat protein (TIGR03803 family)
MHRTSFRFCRTLALVAAFACLFAGSASAQWTETTISSLTDPQPFYPFYAPEAIFDRAGNLYSTDRYNVYKLTRDAGGTWTETVLYTFTGALAPVGKLLLDPAGNLYGTTQYGGNPAVTCDITEADPFPTGCGIVYELTPTASGPWTETVLYTFSGGNDGGWPRSGVIRDAAGSLYGTTSVGGAGTAGVVYKLTPAATGPWTETLLYTFCPGQGLCTDGGQPFTGLTFDNIGNLYGTVEDSDPDGSSQVFKLTPTPSGAWNEALIAEIPDASAYAEPLAELTFRPSNDHCVRDRDRERNRRIERDARRNRDLICGELYGTSRLGGAYGDGDVFRVQPTEGGTWDFATLYDFQGSDGLQPTSHVIFDDAGNLYGTTVWGGVQGGTCLYPGCGVVFQLTPTTTPPWTESLLYIFLGGPNVGFPGGLAFGPDGNLYGPAAGAVGVFELAPPPDPNDRRDRR